MTAEIKQLKEFLGDIKIVYIFDSRLRNQIGDDRAGGFDQLTIKLRANFMFEKHPEREVGNSEQAGHNGTKQNNHAEAQRSCFRVHSGIPKR